MNKTKKKKKIKLINDLTDEDVDEIGGVKAASLTYNKQGSVPSFCSDISKKKNRRY